MGVITIHGLDEKLDQQLRKIAKQKKQSLNKTLKDIIAATLAKSQTKNNRERFSKFCGCWSRQEHEEFTKATQDFDRIDAEDWN